VRKTLTRTLLPIGVAAAVIGVGAGAASATTPTATTAPVVTKVVAADKAPTLTSIWQQWNKGGAALGYGAASLVSSAFLGVPQTAVDLVHEAAGMS